MKRSNLYLAFLLISVALLGCVREDIKPLPTVEFSVTWTKSRQGESSKAQDATIYLYPQYDYSAEPIIMTTQNGAPIKANLLPGKYKVLVVNTNIDPIKIDGKGSFEKLAAYLEADNGYLPQSPQLMGLDRNDPLREIEVKVGVDNKYEFAPVVVSRRVRFIIEAEKFGDINIAEGYVEGISGCFHFASFAKSEPGKVKIPAWDVDNNKLSSKSVEVLGFNHETEKVILMLLVTTDEVTKPLEQPVDISSEVANMKGDEIEISMKVEFKPDIRISIVSIKEWEAGNELDIEIK